MSKADVIEIEGTVVEKMCIRDRERVQSPLVALISKARKGGDFFYGKSGNENYIESL